MKEIPYDKRRPVYRAAIRQYGETSQMLMLFEEMAELQNAMTKFRRGRDTAEHVAEEIADVTVMLEQMRLIFDCNETVKEITAAKVVRLAEHVCPELAEALLDEQ